MRPLACALMLLALPAGAQPARVEVSLHPRSVVAGAYFRLGEVASVRAADGALERALTALRIGRSPRPGAALALKPAEVERAIVRLMPALPAPVHVSGAPDAAVWRGPLQTLELARVREAASRALQAFVAERSARFTLEPLGAPGGELSLPEGRVELKPRIAPGEPLAARVDVWTDILVDGAHYQSLPLAFAVSAYRPVLVAQRALRPGARLRPGDLAVREEQVAGGAGAPVPPAIEVEGLRLKRALAAGEVLTWRHAEQAPAVSRDQEIVVRLTVGAIALETAAVATQDARPGEVIRVRAAPGSQTYAARVTGPGSAEALWR